MTRLGPPSDHELLFVDDLHLPPVGRPAPRLVARLRALRDEPFPPFGERSLVERASIANDELADAKRTLRAERRLRLSEQPLERGPPLDERPIAPVAAPFAQQVEHDERNGARGS